MCFFGPCLSALDFRVFIVSYRNRKINVRDVKINVRDASKTEKCVIRKIYFLGFFKNWGGSVVPAMSVVVVFASGSVEPWYNTMSVAVEIAGSSVSQSMQVGAPVAK